MASRTQAVIGIKRMNYLYVSALSSERLINEIHEVIASDPGFAVQKFSRLIVRGLMRNGAECKTLTTPPITSLFTSKLWIHNKSEVEKGIVYDYIPFLNVPVLKHLFVCIYTFLKVLKWGFRERTDKVILCDVLNVSSCLGALFATKLLRVKSVAVVTDLYGLMVNNSKSTFKRMVSKSARFVHDWYVSSFDKYIVLTEQMNEKVNPRQRPHMVMEALCDRKDDRPDLDVSIYKDSPRTVIYAGGLYEEYGLANLVDAFISANIPDSKLSIYGDGPYVMKLKKISEEYDNIEYRGVKPNSVVVEDELRATLLVNPRPTTEEFTKYSFPSKNMEYMVSGTPVLTTRLPGMPKEYYPYVFLIEDETIDGYAKALTDVLSKNAEELISFGQKAKNFVLENKNYIIQTRRIIELIQS